MQPTSHVNSSTKSKPAPNGSRASASLTAAAAFQRQLQHSVEKKEINPELAGRQRLAGAFRIELAKIEADPNQPRRHFDETALNELAASLKERGVKQPLTVRWNAKTGRYRIIDGERRYRAASKAGMESIPCIIDDPDAKETLIDQIVANWQRSDLRPYETADALVRLKTLFGMGVTDLACVTGKSKGEVSKLISLVENVDEVVKQLVRDVEGSLITKRHLYALTQLDADQQRRMAARIQRENLTALETEHLIRSDAAIEPDEKNRKKGRPRKHVRIKTAWGDVTLSPIGAGYDSALLLKMLHDARRRISSENM